MRSSIAEAASPRAGALSSGRLGQLEDVPFAVGAQALLGPTWCPTEALGRRDLGASIRLVGCAADLAQGGGLQVARPRGLGHSRAPSFGRPLLGPSPLGASRTGPSDRGTVGADRQPGSKPGPEAAYRSGHERVQPRRCRSGASKPAPSGPPKREGLTVEDFVIIGAGAAGEAAAHEARRHGASVTVVERELLGGSCPFWACMPSKTLLHAAGVHALGGDYPWPRASARRDYMINREGRDWPDDGGHLRALEAAGATVIRGEAKLAGPGRVVVRTTDGGELLLEARNIVIAVGSRSTVPDLPGLDEIRPWTNREATSTRTLPRSLVVLGGGPTGVELGQVFARYGVPVTIVHSKKRLNHRDHPRNSAALARALAADGVDLRLGARAVRIEPAPVADRPHRVVLSDGSVAEGHEVLLAIGRTAPLADLGLETIGVELVDGRLRPDEQLRIAEGVYVAGDPAGPELHTHLAHYEGEVVVRIALGEDVRPDVRAIPRATYTDPETAGVGLTVEEARAAGLDAGEWTADLATSAKGYVAEAEGHATIVVDQGSGRLVGAFLAGPGASEAIHEAVLAIKTETPIAVLADTIHAFPTVARVMGSLFVEAWRELAGLRRSGASAGAER